jgi:hypothetical protein
MQNINEKLKNILSYDNTVTNNGVSITIRESDSFDSPFECSSPSDDRMALVVTGHRSFGFADTNLTHHGFQADMGLKLAKKWFKNTTGKTATFAKKVYLHQHGNATLETSPSCPWDSGFLGFIVGHKGDFRKYSKGTPDYDTIMRSYLKEWNFYLNGNCYGYNVEVDGKHEDSCGGFMGDWDDDFTGLLEYLVMENESMIRIFLDDSTLTLDECVLACGEQWARNLAQANVDTHVGRLCHAKYYTPAPDLADAINSIF